MNAVEQTKKLQRQEERRVRVMIHNQREADRVAELTGKPGPTPETRQKVGQHPIERLMAKGFLDEHDEQALLDIAEAYTAITAAVGYASGTLERVDNSGARMPQERAMIAKKRYSLWWDELQRLGLQRCFYPVIDLAVDGLSFNAMSEARGIDWHTARKRVRAGLDAYHDAQKGPNKK